MAVDPTTIPTAAGQKVNAIVVAPADSKALVPACKKAVDAGIIQSSNIRAKAELAKVEKLDPEKPQELDARTPAGTQTSLVQAIGQMRKEHAGEPVAA